MNKTKVNVIGGFLGSGKTTLLRQILSTPKLPEKIALMINEIGAAVIDAKVLREIGSGVVELPNGCICCSVTGDFIQSLLDIKKQFSPDRIFIEPTGIAEPGRILSALYRPPLESELRVEPTIIIIDAGGFEKLFQQLAYLYVMQIKSADIILLNKSDRVKESVLLKVEKEIRELNPKAWIVPTTYCKVDLLGLLEGKKAKNSVSERSHSSEKKSRAHGHELFESLSFESFELFSKVKLEKFLSGLPAELFRVKGFVRTSNENYLLNYVAGQIEWELFPSKPESTILTCIGKRLDRKRILSELKSCALPSKGVTYAKNSRLKLAGVGR